MSVLMVYPLGFIYMVTRVYVALLSYSLIALTTVLLYVIACDPLPPCVGKVRSGCAASPPQRAARRGVASRPIHAGCLRLVTVLPNFCHTFRPAGPLRSILPAGLKRDHMHTRTPDDHDDFGGLHRDLAGDARRDRSPRTLSPCRALRRGVGALQLVGCASNPASPSDSSGGSSTGGGSCSARIPEETQGPFPADGSNGPSVLPLAGVVRERHPFELRRAERLRRRACR